MANLSIFSFFSTLIIDLILTTLLVNAQNQSDFISIDCGASEDYTGITGINYSSDHKYIDTGNSNNISQEFITQNDNVFHSVRSFPEGKRNCYKLKPSKGKNHSYLIRASFLYGNYDGLGQLPEFDLYLGVSKWKTVKLQGLNNITQLEIIHVLQSDYIDVCLVKTGVSTPFISVLELRPLLDQIYVAQYGSLELFSRLDCGLTTEPFVRYNQDVLDRIWTPFNVDSWDIINASETQTIEANSYEPPSLVMTTAVTPKDETSLFGFSWRAQNDTEETPEFYLYLHFAEVQKLEDKENREFNIYINNELWYGELELSHLSVTTVYSPTGLKGSSLQVTFNRTENSTLPPILNAFEIYSVKNLSSLQTFQNDVDAILNVKSTYNLTKNWQGDPCLPMQFKWEGLNCVTNGSHPPRITSLKLASSGLTGTIDPHIYNLTLLEELDLSNNNLSGSLPDFLSQMSSLKILNLSGNNFSGNLPIELQEKVENGSLKFSANGNTNLCWPNTCRDNENETHKHNNNNNDKTIIIIVASIGGFMLLLLTCGTILWCITKRKKSGLTTRNIESSNQQEEELQPKKQEYSYSEILSITNNFGRIIGKGGFGTVYLGSLKGTQVAVKMLSPLSAQGYIQFHSEAKLLTRVHHRNLTDLIGYCDEGPKLGLVYEYMSNGDLSWHLSDKNKNPLNWEERLKVATDVAQGLEYLHCGCKPSIIHRDVKATNILLNDRLQAKLSDFGLSRAFTLENDIVVGTPGYVDPEYSLSNRLTEKSDVFSFGVVLLEIITGRQAISSKNNGKNHIHEWVQQKLSDGDIKGVVDPRLEQDFNENSISKAVEIAMECVATTSMVRPTMSQVIEQLNQCLGMEVARNKNIDIMSINSDPALFGR